MHGRPSHQRTPVEGETEHDLRPVGDAFHKRIDRDQRQRGETEPYGIGIEREQHGKADEALHGKERPGGA